MERIYSEEQGRYVNEIIYKGDNIFKGYAHEAKDLEYLEEIKELKTGDYGEIDEEGYMYIHGRMNNFSKINGIRICHNEIEKLISSHEMISATKCVDEKLIIYIETDLNVQSKLIKDLREQISNSQRIHLSCIKITTVVTLPRKDSGKIDYSLLK